MFNETSLPKKEGFYSNLNMEDMKDSDYNLAELSKTNKDQNYQQIFISY